MNETTLQERAKKLLEINEIIKQLDPTIRPGAFLLLQDYVLSGTSFSKEVREVRSAREQSESDGDRVEFFSKFNTEKPSDNAILLAAYHYSQYGSAQFTAEEIKTLANEVGLVVPERVDMTFRNAQRDGKSLFQSAGGAFKPTVQGELFMKSSYQVAKGKQEKPQNGSVESN